MVPCGGLNRPHPMGVIHPPRVTTAHLGELEVLGKHAQCRHMAVLFLVFGFKLVGDGIAVLS